MTDSNELPAGFDRNPRSRKTTSSAFLVQKVELFHNRHGHARITDETCDDDETLFAARVVWGRFRRGELAGPQVDRLSKIGFFYRKRSLAWLSQFEELKKFRVLFGHTNVSENWSDKRLVHFVLGNRHKRRRGKLSDERIAMLDSIGFNWNPKLSPLGVNNVHRQRREYYCVYWTAGTQSSHQKWKFFSFVEHGKERALELALAERRMQLDKYICAVLADPTISEDSKRRRLDKYHRDIAALDEGNLAKIRGVRYRLDDYIVATLTANKETKVARFCVSRYGESRAVRLALERIQSWRTANTTGVTSGPTVFGETMPTSMQEKPDDHVRQPPEIDLDSHISILEEYHQCNGHAHIYDVTCDENVLASAKLIFYLSVSNKLNSFQKRRLSDIGFRYNRGKWRRHLLELIDFQGRFGHTRVPIRWKENKHLASFVRRLRRLRKRNKLPSSVIARFDEIGFVWNVYEHSTGITNLRFYRRAGYRAVWTDPATGKRKRTYFEVGEHLDAKDALLAAISERRRRLDQYICAVWNDPHISDASKDRCVKKYEEDIQSLDSGDIATMRGIRWFEKSGFRVDREKNGVCISRSFSSQKYGDERAKALALEYLESLRQA